MLVSRVLDGLLQDLVLRLSCHLRPADDAGISTTEALRQSRLRTRSESDLPVPLTAICTIHRPGPPIEERRWQQGRKRGYSCKRCRTPAPSSARRPSPASAVSAAARPARFPSCTSSGGRE